MFNRKTSSAEGKPHLSTASIISIVLCLILLPVLVINTVLIVKGFANKDKVPTVGGMAPMIVLSDSMTPEIESGDMIIIREIDANELKEGDAIAFFDPSSKKNAVVTHRIIEVVESEDGLLFKTKGDANNAEDPNLVPEEKVVGIWNGTVIKGAGSVALFIQSTPGLILCIVVPILLLGGVELMRRRKYESKTNDEKEALLAELEELRALKAEKAEGMNMQESVPVEGGTDEIEAKQ